MHRLCSTRLKQSMHSFLDWLKNSLSKIKAYGFLLKENYLIEEWLIH